MNGHTKLAIFVAPFLVIGGYVASDYYVKYKQGQRKLYQLSVVSDCILATNQCQLVGDELVLELSDKNGVTTLISNHPLDAVTLSVVNEDSDETVYRMEKGNDHQHWRVASNISRIGTWSSSPLTLRIGAIVENSLYISEFKTLWLNVEQTSVN